MYLSVYICICIHGHSEPTSHTKHAEITVLRHLHCTGLSWYEPNEEASALHSDNINGTTPTGIWWLQFWCHPLYSQTPLRKRPRGRFHGAQASRPQEESLLCTYKHIYEYMHINDYLYVMLYRAASRASSPRIRGTVGKRSSPTLWKHIVLQNWPSVSPA